MLCCWGRRAGWSGSCLSGLSMRGCAGLRARRMRCEMVDVATQKKWDKAAPTFDFMAGKGPEVRWKPFKERLFSHMDGRILFLALGTGLDSPTFPPGKDITAIDISPKMLEQARERIEGYDGKLHAEV